MRELPLPQELSRFATLPNLQYRGNGEWSSACVVCGGEDRFRLFAADGKGNSRVWCRQCSHFEWADTNDNQRPDPVKIQQALDLRAAMLQAENERLRGYIRELRENEYWRGYHDGMKDAHRALWRKAGIPDMFQDWWELGFVENKHIKIKDQDYYSPAMSIPYFEPGKVPVNIQYRLTNPPDPKDKYRFSYGLKPGAWLAEPDSKPSGACLLMEGMKKAAVTFINTVADGNGRFSVVAVPSKTPGADMLTILADCDPVYICLDPDAYQPTKAREGKMLPAAVNRLAGMVGRGRARLVTLPAKADDLFIEYGFDARMFMGYIQHAAKVN